MSGQLAPYVFDSGPLSHFTEAGWLGLLEFAVGEHPAWLPDTVRQEAADGVNWHPHLRGILDAPWLTRRTLETDAEGRAFARYTERLLGDDGRRNLGECEVLALAEANQGIAVLDDGTARELAATNGIEFVTSLGLLAALVRETHLSLEAASKVADRLLETEYYLDIGPEGFRMWAIENDYLPYTPP